ncbi:MAG: transcription termination factor NusA [Terriglobales bacterium]
MPSDLYNTIEGLSRERGIDPQIVVSAVEDAIVVATRKSLKSQENLRAVLDKETGDINVYAVKNVVETPDQVTDPINQVTLDEARALDGNADVGGEVLIHRARHEMKNPAGLGRISAQLAKQVLFQKVREAERDTVYNEYIGRVGEIVNATLKRVEGPDLIFDIGKAEARMPRKEQSRLESFAVGERTRVVIVRVEKSAKGPQVVVSRAAPELVQHLFQTEVPEIYDGTVQIRAIAREAGERTKIAVYSKDKDVDAVGACVGMKGMRVQSIIRELRGEKIDIIEWHEDPVTFAEKALQPAKVSRVTVLDSAEKHLEVIVDDTQLSLAIGKKGQNVRLAAKLLGWKIDIKSEEEKRQEVEQQMQALVTQPATPLERVPELGEAIIEKLTGAGVASVEALADMTPEQLEAIPGIGPKTVEKISIAVNNYFSSLESGVAPAAEVAAADEPGESPSDTVQHPDEPLGETDDSPVPPELEPKGEPVGVVNARDASTGDPTKNDVTLEPAPDESQELFQTQQTVEGIRDRAVEDAPPADEADVQAHQQHPDEKDIPPEKQ